ncbi:hypothetical protein ACTHQY_15050 [Rhodococcoides corynebacterioides]|uniref:hypothetical protein n=1 Tax=Rhodococcoides corynebacterioides TaxID=53972 RepID=UPI003F7FBC1E
MIRKTLAGRRAEWQLRAHVRVLRATKAVERHSAEKVSAAMVEIRTHNQASRSAAGR